jgi:hypothetical protein
MLVHSFVTMFEGDNQQNNAEETNIDRTTSRKYFTAVLYSHLNRITYHSTQYQVSRTTETPFLQQLCESWCKSKEYESVLDLTYFYLLSRSEIELMTSKQSKKVHNSADALRGLLMRNHFLLEQVFKRLDTIHREKVENVRNTRLNHTKLLQDFFENSRTCTLAQFKKFIFTREMVCYIKYGFTLGI